MQHEVSMLKIRKVVLHQQLLRLQIEMRKDILDENKISFLKKDILKLQQYIKNNDWQKG
jgi:bifunctional ADP-heptose synthase (sugar kinase/adenylyltransferase)